MQVATASKLERTFAAFSRLLSGPSLSGNIVGGKPGVVSHLLHKDTHKRINMRPYEPDLGEVERSDLVKGYEYEKGHYVVMDQDDFDKAQIESTKTIAIERFVDEELRRSDLLGNAVLPGP